MATQRGTFGTPPSKRQPIPQRARRPTPREKALPRRGTAGPSGGTIRSAGTAQGPRTELRAEPPGDLDDLVRRPGDVVGLLRPGAGTSVAAETGGDAHHLDGGAARGQRTLRVPSTSNIRLVVADIECPAGGEPVEFLQAGKQSVGLRFLALYVHLVVAHDHAEMLGQPGAGESACDLVAGVLRHDPVPDLAKPRQDFADALEKLGRCIVLALARRPQAAEPVGLVLIEPEFLGIELAPIEVLAVHLVVDLGRREGRNAIEGSAGGLRDQPADDVVVPPSSIRQGAVEIPNDCGRDAHSRASSGRAKNANRGASGWARPRLETTSPDSALLGGVSGVTLRPELRLSTPVSMRRFRVATATPVQATSHMNETTQCRHGLRHHIASAKAHSQYHPPPS